MAIEIQANRNIKELQNIYNRLMEIEIFRRHGGSDSKTFDNLTHLTSSPLTDTVANIVEKSG